MNPIGEAIRELREEHGWTQDELGQRVGIAANGISKRETGLVRVDAGERRKFAEAFGLTILEFNARWHRTQSPQLPRRSPIPVLNYSSAGVVLDHTEIGTDYGQVFASIPRWDVDDEFAFAVIVVSESMAPTLHEGDHVVFSPLNVPRPKAHLNDGAIVFVRFTTKSSRVGCLMARWFGQDDTMVQLKQDNPSFPAMIVHRDEIKEISVAIEYRTRRRLA